MSFSAIAKDALLRKKSRTDSENQIMLMAMTACIGTITLRRGRGMGIKYTTETLQVARLISKCALTYYDVDSELTLHETATRKSSRSSELVLFGKDVEKILVFSELLDSEEYAPPTISAEEAVFYLRGAFLACGSITDPNKSYHLEIACRNELAAQNCTACAKMLDLPMKYVKRKDCHVAYLKDGESISSFLTVIGADDAVLEFENIRVYRDTRNYANRTRNCDIANISKSYNAAMRQVSEIEFLLKNSGESIPDYLFETATARLEHPDATLAEFADILGIGKSGANHRLQKLLKLAENLHELNRNE